MTILLITTSLFLAGLIVERFLLLKRLDKIPLRITVTGTRGKSSVVRLIASILREDGRAVLAKTTGSEACYILPDGQEKNIQRRGITSILEQTKLIKKAVAYHADILVAEVMSIHPENHFIESGKLLKPHVVAITNVRCDHTYAMGNTKEEIASVLALDITENAQVFSNERECSAIFEAAAKEKNALYRQISSTKNMSDYFQENIELARQVASSLKVKNETIEKGIQKTQNDIGVLKVWKIKAQNKNDIFFVNAFAANDPQSTYEAFELIRDKMPFIQKWIGLFAARAAKGDRTLQWIGELKNGGSNLFDKLIIMGDNRRAVKRKLPKTEITINNHSKNITDHLLNSVPQNGAVFGFGNIGGLGKQLVQHWKQTGEEYGL